ncbi:CHAT domain-containing protein [Kitasatospora mediocidica]|uniref:CHAT domain-containing protein n=1 Tax=Kitasatospora mediocidica TaxID=58352 RepID=UPI00055BEC51|nr:CHAT domain-containing protein [Kitasatospora mediocidica]
MSGSEFEDDPRGRSDVPGVMVSVMADFCARQQEEYLRSGDPERLIRAVRYGRAAVAAAALDNPYRPHALSNLGGALAFLHQVNGDPALLDEAVGLEREAVRLTPTFAPERAMRLYNLGTALFRKHRSTRQIRFLEEAVTLLREAVAIAPPADGHRSSYFSDLGGGLRELYLETGRSAYIEESVQAQRQAIALAPDCWQRIRTTNNLAGALESLWMRTGRVEVLEDSVELLRTVVAETDPQDPARAQRIINLTLALGRLHARTDRLELVEEAIPLAREALRLTPRHDSSYPRQAQDLAALLVTAFQNARHFTDSQAMSSGDPVRDAVRQLIRTGWMQDPALLREAEALARTAVDATPANDPSLPVRLSGLAVALEAVHGMTGSGQALDEALRLFRTAANHPLTHITQRVPLLHRIAGTAGATGRATVAIAAVRDVLELLEPLAPLDLDAPDREHRLSLLGELPGIAAAAAMEAGDPDLALDLLERTRGITAREFMARRKGSGTAADRAPIGHRIAEAPADGTVVILTGSTSRCDALVVGAGRGVSVVPLPQVTYKKLIFQARLFRMAWSAVADRRVSPEGRDAAHQEMADVLGWLWQAVAEPVLAHLGLTRPHRPGRPWSHVTWCPVGVFGLLPVHAAGRYPSPADLSPAPGQTVLDHVVSSYTTTLTALLHTRSRGLAEPGREMRRRKILIVPSPDTAVGALPGAEDEADELTQLLPSAEVLRQPGRAEVLRVLPDAPIVHFACHAVTHPVDPSQSHLELGDGDESSVSVSEIRDLDVRGSLAYLSACQASVGADHLLDEGIHVAGAFQLAGYRHVIGTLWPIDDRVAGKVAAAFYQGLLVGGTGPIDVGRSALSLHRATRRMRDSYPRMPFLWAAFAHWGPED